MKTAVIMGGIVGVGLLFALHAPLNSVGHAVDVITPDDRSFFVEIDKDAWPGDSISEAQYKAAVDHFANDHACSSPWRWALIGPNTFLLKGTRYQIARVADAPAPNIHAVHGYWGGIMAWDIGLPIALAKQYVEIQATADCAYGARP